MICTYEITPLLARRAFRRYGWRTWGGFHIGVLVVGVIGLIGTVTGDAPWLYGFLLGLGVAYGLLWWSMSVSAERAIATLADRRVTLEIDDDAFRWSANGVLSIVQWHALTSAWKYPDMWFLVIGGSRNPIVVPETALTPEAKSIITHKIQQSGGKIA